MTELNEINNAFEQEMIDAGYKPFKSSFKQYAERGFQKRITDEHGTKYFINIWHYKNPYRENQESYTADGQFRFNNKGKDAACNVEYWGDVFLNPHRELTTLKDIEEFFEKFFNTMNPDYYERHD